MTDLIMLGVSERRGHHQLLQRLVAVPEQVEHRDPVGF